MKISQLLALAITVLGFQTSAFAGATYQATGPVLEVTDSKIVIQKDKEKWEIARTPATKVAGEIKVGSKITVQYTMTAASVEVKPDKDAKPAPALPAVKKP